MLFKLHTEKKKWFDVKGNALLGRIKQKPDEPKNIKESLKGIYSFDTKTFTDIQRRGWLDKDNEYAEVGILFDHNNTQFGWFFEDFISFNELVEDLLKVEVIGKTISKRRVKDILFDWLKGMYKNEINVSLTDYALDRFKQVIETVEIWIPINNLSVYEPLKINNLLFKKLDEKTINHWYNEDLRRAPKSFDFITKIYQDKIGEGKDKVFSIYSNTGEREKCFEIAFEETKKIITVLHLYSEIIKNPFSTSYVFVLGQENLQYVKHLIVKDNILITPNEQALSFLNFWEITKADIKKFDEKGFSKVLNLFYTEKINDYEKNLRAALRNYLRICFLKEIEYKIILIFSALETMFIGKESEGITKNLSESVAMFVGIELEERKRILQNLRKVYNLRSKFVHSAHLTDVEKDSLKYFFNYVWDTFMLLIENPNNFRTKKELCDFIQDKKLS